MGNCMTSKKPLPELPYIRKDSRLQFVVDNYPEYIGKRELADDEPLTGSLMHIQISQATVNEYFQLDSQIEDTGDFGIVKRAFQRNLPDRPFALKILPKAQCNNHIYEEATLLSECDHPNIVRFYEIFECEKKVYFQTEFCAGENLQAIVKKKRRFSEKELRVIFRQVLLAINHMHIRGICHRDIASENIMFGDANSLETLKLLDFGFAKRFFGNNGKIRFYKVVGSPKYMAPEVFTGDYDERCDIWSAGILLYKLATGQLPYSFNDKKDFYENFHNFKIDFKQPFKGSKYSRDLFDLLQAMLTVNEQTRISLTQALVHAWFYEDVPPSPSSASHANLISNFRSFKSYNFFQKNVFKIYAKRLSKDSTQEETQLFNLIDRDLDGIISFPELKFFLIKSNMFVGNSECINHIQSLHQTDNHHIFYTEFVASTIDKNFIFCESSLRNLYDSLKLKKEENLSIESIMNIYILAGYSFKRDNFDRLLVRSGISLASGKDMTFGEFKVLMTKDLKVIASGEDEIRVILETEKKSKTRKSYPAQ